MDTKYDSSDGFTKIQSTIFKKYDLIQFGEMIKKYHNYDWPVDRYFGCTLTCSQELQINWLIQVKGFAYISNLTSFFAFNAINHGENNRALICLGLKTFSGLVLWFTSE